MMDVEKFYQAFCDELGFKPEELDDEASLYPDLGISGADGYQLIERLRNDFDVDFSAFECGRYIGPEAAFFPLSNLCDRLTGKHREDLALVRKFTVGHLKNVCERQKWYDPS